jgi:dipeptidyl aminopeptidase/acylaminoacyl peptidase
MIARIRSGEMLFRSLKVLGRPVEYVVPEQLHEITRSGDNRQRMDQLLRTFEFFERWTDKSKEKLAINLQFIR